MKDVLVEYVKKIINVPLFELVDCYIKELTAIIEFGTFEKVFF
jgi:hypothetical protein